MRKTTTVLLLAIWALVASSVHLMATVIPPNLPAGSQYQLIFFTANYFSASSADIGDYNTFVTAEAAQNPMLPQGVTWRAVGSTASIEAYVNAPTHPGVPIYNTHGELVVPGTQNLYANLPLLNPVNYDQFGTHSTFRYVFTGSTPLGERSVPYFLGSPDGSSIVGYNDRTNSQWIDSNGAITQTYSFASLYALSDPITVSVPEPSSAVMFVLGFVGLVWWRLRSE